MKRWLWSFLVLFLAVFLVGGATSWASEDDLRQMLEELKKEVEQLKQENANLKSQIEAIKGTAQVPAAAPVTKPKASFYSKGAYGSTPSAIDFYGFFKIDAVWQDSKAIGDNYVLFVLPGSQGKNDQQFTLNFRHSRIGFDFSKDYKGFDLFAKIEMDFYTQGDTGTSTVWNDIHAPLRARRVFAGVKKGTWELLAGLDWLTISQLYPHTLNFPAGSFMGNPGFRMTQVRLTKLIPLDDISRLKVQVAAEQSFAFPRSSSSAGTSYYDMDPANDAGFPGIEARVAYETKIYGKPALLALWGHYSQEEYDLDTNNDGQKDKEEDADSYSIGLEVKVPLTIARKAFISGEIWYGNNFDGYYVASVDQGTKFLTNTGWTTLPLASKGIVSAQYVETIEAVGGWLELELFWTPKFVTHFGWGIDNPKDSDLAGVSKARLQQQMYYANFIYRLTRAFAYGMEYMYVRCDYLNDDDGKLNRFMGSLFYFF